MIAKSLTPRTKRPEPSRAVAAPRSRESSKAVPAASPGLPHARDVMRQGLAGALDRLSAIEGEVASLVRGSVAESLAATRGAVLDVSGVIREVFAGAADAAGDSAFALRAGIQGAARGTVTGVHDAGADLSGAASEIMKAAITEGHRVGAEIGAVARAALDGVAQAWPRSGGALQASRCAPPRKHWPLPPRSRSWRRRPFVKWFAVPPRAWIMSPAMKWPPQLPSHRDLRKAGRLRDRCGGPILARMLRKA